MKVTENKNKPFKKAVLLGLPNTGKSHVFYNLTKEYTLVANSPFTTVETKKATCKIGNEIYEVIDTPGLHDLYIHSEEELVVRDLIFAENPDVIVQCIDANRLKQSLVLTADLIELGIPMVISLNAIDETSKRGTWIDSEQLARILGIEVVESVAIKGLGTKELKHAIKTARKPECKIQYGNIIDEGISEIEAMLPEDLFYKRKIANLLLLNDPFLLKYLDKICSEELNLQLNTIAVSVRRKSGGNLNRLINKKQHMWVDGIAEKILKKQKLTLGGFSKEAARLSRHPIFGIPILLGVLFTVFFSVVNVANVIAVWMNTTFWVPIESSINNIFQGGFWNEFLVGDYGVLTLGVSNALLTVLPILGVFFLLFNIIEDTGYIPNLCVLLKRLSEKVGLSGNAVMPVTLGFGCKTMATLTTKSLRSKKERYISIYLIAFALPCAAQMALNMSILGNMGARAFLIAFSVLVFVEILAGVLLNKIIKEEKKEDFIQELPDMRVPDIKAVLKKTYYKLIWFLKEAMPVFIFAALILFTADKIGLLQAIKIMLKPLIVGFLGFPLEMVDVLILCMAKHEAAAGMIIKLIGRGELNYIQTIVAVTITTMFVPCLANVIAMFKELGAKRAMGMVLTINASAFLIAGCLNWALVLLIK